MQAQRRVRNRIEPPAVGLRVVREIRGLTLPSLAERIEEHLGYPVHPDSLSNIERGWARPSNALQVAWAKALGIDPLEVRPAGAVYPERDRQPVLA